MSLELKLAAPLLMVSPLTTAGIVPLKFTVAPLTVSPPLPRLPTGILKVTVPPLKLLVR